MPPQLDEGRFVPLVSGREFEWLSIATMVVHEMGSCRRESLLDHVGEICADYEKGLAKRVLKYLESALPAMGTRRRAMT